ncbi:hypothetical protein KJ688_08820 [bacterium]|nr:hypothetical protein [bacterium]
MIQIHRQLSLLSNGRVPIGTWLLPIILLSVFFIRCTERKLTGPYDNLPPDTKIFISTTRQLNPTQSVQTISWDGRDPDGFIIGYYYTWKENPDSADWIFTTKHAELFPLVILGTDTSYMFQVKAVDDDSLADPTPACQAFPIRNSPPTIRWTLVSRIPDTTFTVASLIWEASDLDGDSTIDRFEYALDEPDNWRAISGYNRIVTLNADDGLTEGKHCFYIRAVDVAGAESEIIRMPDDTTRFWYVKEPKGRYLLIDDHASESSTYSFPDRYYRNMMNNVLPGEGFDVWNIEKLFPLSVIQFTETIKLFDRIIWYTDLVKTTDPHFIAAQVALPAVIDAGAKVIFIAQFNTGFGAQGDPLAFSPVDSLGKYYDRIPPNSIFIPQPDFKTVFPAITDSLPELKVSNFIFGVIATPPKEGNIILYRYNDASLPENPPFVLLGRNDNTDEYDFVFSGAPLHQMNGNGNLDEFFNIIFNRIFDAN